MKVETKYVCELCGTVYSDKSSCEACERGHFANLKIISCKQCDTYKIWQQYITVQKGETDEYATYELKYSQVYD